MSIDDSSQVPPELNGRHRLTHEAVFRQAETGTQELLRSHSRRIARRHRVLIFGSGTGESGAMDHLISELKRNHADGVAHVTGAVVVDAHHLTDAQLLAEARAFYSPGGI